ncbi:MAG: aminopeptidase P family protein [Firmicutes bacterium]|nr:aminopeptidase P family protein [Bacillota bacterium]
MNNRLEKIRKLFSKYRIDALLVSSTVNCKYLSGFTGTSATLVIDPYEAFLLTDFRYIEQAKDQCPQFHIIEVSGEAHLSLSRLLADRGIRKLGSESDYLTYNQFTTLRDKLVPVKLIPVKGAVQSLRKVKDSDEISAIKQSMDILDSALNNIISQLKPGITEREIALNLEFFARKQGATGNAFDFIVASGPRSALPHGTASPRALQHGELVTIDLGVIYGGYASDMTRTFAVGQCSEKQKLIYNIVLEALLAGMAAIRPGVEAKGVDHAARSVIESYGYGSSFGHGTGHGVGLEVHEDPRLSKKSDTVLEKGMVVTVEPGIYLPGWGGVRIEDTVVVEERGCRALCGFPKDSLICT